MTPEPETFPCDVCGNGRHPPTECLIMRTQDRTNRCARDEEHLRTAGREVDKAARQSKSRVEQTETIVTYLEEKLGTCKIENTASQPTESESKTKKRLSNKKREVLA